MALAPASISVRTRPAGGPVGDARPEPLTIIRDENSLILLIHGFAVTEPAAVKAFGGFRTGLRPFDERAINIFWPGDWGTFGITQASYPLQRRRALDSVSRLESFLKQELDDRLRLTLARGTGSRPLELRVVAHSLGCLVALELVKLLGRSEDELQFSLLVLMAAAVPQYRLAHDDLGKVFGRIRNVHVYHSYNDWVLALAFRAGEQLHRPFPEGWTKRSAIGRNGCGRRFENVEERLKHHGHSGYWSDWDIAAAVRADVADVADGTVIRRQEGRRTKPRITEGRRVGDSL